LVSFAAAMAERGSIFWPNNSGDAPLLYGLAEVEGEKALAGRGFLRTGDLVLIGLVTFVFRGMGGSKGRVIFGGGRGGERDESLGGKPCGFIAVEARSVAV
jgi:hypothetical protein